MAKVPQTRELSWEPGEADDVQRQRSRTDAVQRHRSEPSNATLLRPLDPRRRSAALGCRYAPLRPMPELEQLALPAKAATKSWPRTRTEAVAELAGCDVEVDRLRELGFTPEDLARVVYEKVQAEELPNFLKHIQIDADGGIDKIADMWDQQKVLWFSILVGSVVCNVASLLLLNWTLCGSFLFFVGGVWRRHGNIQQPPMVEPETVHASWLKLDLEQHMPEPHLQARFLTVAACIAAFEVAWIFCSVMRCIYLFMHFVKGKSEYEAFASISQLLQDLLPRMSTFSSISLMAKVHPSLIYSEYQDAVEHTSLRKCWAGWFFVSASFSLSRLLCAVAAVCGFSIKMVATTLRLVNPKYGQLVPWLYVLALINQCMGCVLVERVLQDRIFLFVFGGHDTSYQDDERALRSAYMCRVAKEIWQHFWKGGQRFKAVVLLATFDHYDLQRLIIEDMGDVEAVSRHGSLALGPLGRGLSMPSVLRAGSLERRCGT